MPGPIYSVIRTNVDWNAGKCSFSVRIGNLSVELHKNEFINLSDIISHPSHSCASSISALLLYFPVISRLLEKIIVKNESEIDLIPMIQFMLVHLPANELLGALTLLSLLFLRREQHF
ncbi:hypothetical protein L596_014274 [Steinernema carpocapsae]|uniref:Uncharacterized protein n=1 Tax=Steinernema carpocapsae TaxID=34508 RepID=A0A4U5NBZ7_STECR|nr:hypothetical protein L596_014274 [Steinernema carpocapsae]